MARDLVTLVEPETGSRAAVAVGLGFNCFEFQTRCEGETFDVLWAHPDFAGGGERPSGSGIPLLFPFAGRIAGAAFEYQGRRWTLEDEDGRGNAIHGFVLRRRWRVIEQSAARVVGQFHAGRDDPALLDRWPADFRVTVAYELRGGALVSEIEIDNPDREPLPFGFGTHAYFRVPPMQGGDASAWRAAVPVGAQWELADLLPTGKQRTSGIEARLKAGLPFDECRFDHVFTDLDFTAGRCVTRLYHAETNRAILQTFDEAFRHCVVYTPPHREAICMEPYTALPDYFRLEAAGTATGLRVLPPGERWRTQISIAAR